VLEVALINEGVDMNKVLLMGLSIATVLLAAGCSSTPAGGGSGATKGASASSAPEKQIVIGYLSPDATTSTRWDTQDRPAFLKAVKQLAPNAKVIVSDAHDQSAQQRQAESDLTQGANVLVINPITADGAAPIADAAKQQHVPLVAYDGLLTKGDISAYVSYNAEKVGEIQAQYLADHLKAGSTIAIINGAQVCDSCINFKVGAHKVLDPLFASGKLKKGYEADTPGWLTTNAQRETEQALTKLNNKVDGILAANDGLAQGVVAALKSQHLNGKVLVTGQDATIPGLQSILVGDQTMTVYKNIPVEAAAAAKVAVALARGEKTPSDLTSTVKAENGQVPALLLSPQAVDAKNLADTVIKDKFVTKAQICTGSVASHCNF
jgi:D-xylose transport system substrate-binding protein